MRMVVRLCNCIHRCTCFYVCVNTRIQERTPIHTQITSWYIYIYIYIYIVSKLKFRRAWTENSVFLSIYLTSFWMFLFLFLFFFFFVLFLFLFFFFSGQLLRNCSLRKETNLLAVYKPLNLSSFSPDGNSAPNQCYICSFIITMLYTRLLSANCLSLSCMPDLRTWNEQHLHGL